jgi:hypothetical protein
MSASMDTLAYRQAENESQSQTGFQRTECTSECPGDFEDGKFTRTYTGMETVSGSITMCASFFLYFRAYTGASMQNTFCV